MGDELADEIARAAQQHIDENMPQTIEVPTGVAEAEAVRAVQEQFTDAGFDCPEDEARRIVREAWDSE
ncbi:hypothetical protein [Mycobacterium persicum]|uniref:hypothetical protein n=1 Tax=Mycobacterium persicum TaxID=1487726 RepID=UPI000A0C0A91|nr:hypothetical protein [Mycobacterium persicum]ORC02202.1 hypothetical protein B1T48_13965 [Mycobacterium persicum]